MKTIPYMGSKRKLLPFLKDSLEDYLQGTEVHSFFDAFAGSGRVSHHFRNRYKIIANDRQSYTKVILEAYLQNNKDLGYYQALIDGLNALPLSSWSATDGWYTRTYGSAENNGSSIGLDGKPKPWVDYNAMKIDCVRTKIDDMYPSDCVEKSVLLLSLMLGVSRISNWMGHQTGYFKDWKKGKLRHVHLELPPIEASHKFKHTVHCKDMYDIIDKVESDITYVDPPYGTNNKKVSRTGGCRYDSFYHLWNNLVRNDKPEVSGRANRRVELEGYCGDLEYNDKSIVIPSFERILTMVQSPYLMFSYSNKGLLSLGELEDVITAGGFDRTSIVTYKKLHTKNAHTKSSRTRGHCIDRPNEKEPLTEYAILARR